jgi:hypothetical protein
MRRVGTIVAMAAAALLAAGCSGRERVVAEPLDSVQAKLSMMPEQSNALQFAYHIPGSSMYLEPQADRLVWHFTKDGADYCRFSAQLIAAGPAKTRVITRAEDAPEASQAAVAAGGKPADYSYLCGVARIAGDESVAATLENRPADKLAIGKRLQGQMMTDASGFMKAVDASLDDEIRRREADDPCNNPQSQRCRNQDNLRARAQQRREDAGARPQRPGTFSSQ